MLSITYFYREPRKTGLSIEGIFRLVKECLHGKVDIKEFYCDASISRLANTRLVKNYAGQINHITGDVHFLALGLKGRKNILTIHDLGHCDKLRKRSFLQYYIYTLFWYRLPLRHIDIVTVVSQFTKEKLMEYFQYPEDRIRLIYDPVKPVFKFSERKQCGVTPHILMLGTGAHKNLNGLIEASKDTNFHLDIIGWPSDEELTKLKNYNIPHTVFNRLTDEQVYERYVACDILFMASFYEGFGMPIVEAQSVGRPVITSNIGAMKEVAGNTAMLVDPNNVTEIKQALLQLANDPKCYQQMVEMGKRNTTNYHHQTIANNYLNVYKELAGVTGPETAKRNIVYLYSEVMPYAIAVMRALVSDHGAAVNCVYWDKNKRTPFVPVNENGITFHEYSKFDKQSLFEFIDNKKPSIIYVVGRMDKLYLEAALHFRTKYHIVTGSDNQWAGTYQHKLAAVLSPLLYRRYFEYFWVPGPRQHEFARKMGYPESKIIPNLLTADAAVFGKAYSDNLPHKTKKYPHNVVFAGRFATEKGLDLLLDAFKQAKNELNNDWELILIGSGTLPVAPEPYIHTHNFMPSDVLAKESKNWGVFCLPSLKEPWGVVIHEFTMAGLPIICSDKVGASDALVLDNHNGYIFTSGDKNSLKDALVKIMSLNDEELLAMGAKGNELSKIQSPGIAASTLISILN